MKNYASKILSNTSGAAAIVVAVAVSTSLFVMGAAGLSLMSQSKKEALSGARGEAADEFNRSALISTKKLLDSGLIKQTQGGAWTVSDKVELVTEPVQGSNQLVVNLPHCDPRFGEAFSTSGELPDISTCKKVLSVAKLLGPASDGRQQVAVTTTLDKVTRTLNAVIGTVETPEPTPTTTPEPSVPPECVARPLINFEEFAEGAIIGDMTNPYGVVFRSVIGGKMKVARITSAGGSKPDFEAWQSAVCPRKPNRNQLCNAEGAGGARALSVAQSTSTKTIQFYMDLKIPVQEIEFDMLDLDGGESWSFVAYDSGGSAFATVTASSSGYGGNSGNNGITHFKISRPLKEIASVRFTGSKNIKIFGFAIDNIRTGMPACP